MYKKLFFLKSQLEFTKTNSPVLENLITFYLWTCAYGKVLNTHQYGLKLVHALQLPR